MPDPHAVTCRQDANGIRHCAIEVWTYVYDRDGQLLVTVGNRIYRGLDQAAYQRLLAGGMAFHQEVSVPVKGEHYLRTAIHDMVSDNVGAVEVPVAAVARLEPLGRFRRNRPQRLGALDRPGLPLLQLPRRRRRTELRWQRLRQRRRFRFQ